MKLNKIKKGLKYHLVDSTAMIVESHPVFAAIEVGIAGMSDAMSINARLLGTAIAFGGVGYIFGKGRDLSKKLFKITNKTKEIVQHVHDVGYAIAFNLALTPPMYTISQLIAGEDLDFNKIAIGAVSASIFGGLNGSPMGYTMDVFRDLTGLKECNRISYPNVMKKQSLKAKKSLAALLVASSIALTAGVYGLTPDKKTDTNQEPVKEMIAYNSRKENLEEKTYYPKIR